MTSAGSVAGQSAHEIAAETGRKLPERVVLDAKRGVAPSGKPPVRIFVGSEGAQFRPERVLVWSIERVRDPGRVYEIYLMRELVDFDRSHWTTGFTNYRFAIPEFAGSTGRAIYNDEDQIYLRDPGELFDLEMGSHGFLAIEPMGKVDTAVMLLDCARMSSVWNLDAARSQNKKALIAEALKQPGLRGDLPPEWHARDEGFTDSDVFVEGETRLLHYTTLHTQPWHPDPSRFVYRDNPLGEIWESLEREADEAGYQIFSREQPSARHQVIQSQSRAPVEPRSENLTASVAELAQVSGAQEIIDYDPLDPRPERPVDGMVWSRHPESFAEDDLPWILDEAFATAAKFLSLEVDCRAAEKPRQGKQTSWQAPAERWLALLAAASKRRPNVHWHVLLHTSSGNEHHHGGAVAHQADPVVWLIADSSEATTLTALRGLVAELGWAWQSPAAERGELSPPWPDLVLSTGEQSAETARWIRQESDNRTRVVQVGAGAGANTEGLDLVVSTVSRGYFPDERRLELAVPLPRFDADRIDAAVAHWQHDFDGAQKPCRALLLDGSGGMGEMSWEDGGAVGECLRAICHEDEGSAFVLLGPEIPQPARANIALELTETQGKVDVAFVDPSSDSYLAHLALADEFVVAEDEEALLGDVCAMGKPIRLLPVGAQGLDFREQVRRFVASMANASPTNDRGTTRPQQGSEGFFSRLLSDGTVEPPRNFERMKHELIERRAAVEIDSDEPEGGFVKLDSRAEVARRIRTLLGLP